MDKPDRYYIDILLGMLKGVKAQQIARNSEDRLTNDTASIPLINFDISGCKDLP